jgi:uncharacterized protein
MSAPVTRPHPTPRGEERVFYDALREHRLVFQRCDDCDRVVFPLRTICPGCAGEALTLETSAESGVVHSFTTQYRAGSPLLADQAPYTLALVDLDEGFRVLTAVQNEVTVAVGTRVRIVFDDADPELTVLSVTTDDDHPDDDGARDSGAQDRGAQS